MAISARDANGITVIELSGNIRIGKGDVELERVFRERLDAGDRRFVLDMTAVGFIDSAGISETIRCYKRAREADGVVKLVLQPKGKPEEVFQITSLDRVFEIFHSKKVEVVEPSIDLDEDGLTCPQPTGYS